MLLSVLCVIARFRGDQKGVIAILFAVSLFVMAMLIAISLDFARWQRTHTGAKSSLDAAVLAAGRVMQLPDTTEAEILEAAYKTFETNQPKSLQTDEKTVKFSRNGSQIIGTVTAGQSKTTFLSLLGYNSLPVTITSVSELGGKLEVSMVLDITGSMGVNNKLENLQDSAKDLIDIVLPSSVSSDEYRRVAVVPFSTFVNIGTEYFDKVTGTTVPGATDQLTCIAERNTVDRYTDAIPTTGNYFTYMSYYFGTSFPCPTFSTVMPLTNDKDRLKDHIDSFTIVPSATAGHLGTAWAWYTLSPKWRHDVWFECDDPPCILPRAKRVAILMTDGDYNAQYSGDASRIQARELCTRMKAEKIEVFTVGFEVPDNSSAAFTMRECASSQDHYYNAVDGNALKAAYRDIALKIFTLRLVE